MAKTIGNPLSWFASSVLKSGEFLGRVEREMTGADSRGRPVVQDLTPGDIRAALAAGWQDFLAARTDAVFLAAIYPVAGLIMAVIAFHGDLLHLVFPLVAGFLIVGPVALAGLYELSRRRERGEAYSWNDMFSVLASPAIGPIAALGAYLVALFVVWIALASVVWRVTMGDFVPQGPAELLAAVLTTPQGWALIAISGVIGIAVGIAALAISIVAVPMMIDRHVGVPAAVATSLAVFRRNAPTVIAWGAVVAALVFLGALPLLTGLVVVLPVIGHASWHLYRRAVRWEE